MEKELTRRCKKCGRVLPITNFRENHGYYIYQCRECENEHHRICYSQDKKNLALDRVPWPYDNDSCEMDEEAIEEWRRQREFLK